jgi:hypothetical protein
MSKDLVHVFFYALPLGSNFLFQRNAYQKVEANVVISKSTGTYYKMFDHEKVWTTKRLADAWGFEDDDYVPKEKDK